MSNETMSMIIRLISHLIVVIVVNLIEKLTRLDQSD